MIAFYSICLLTYNKYATVSLSVIVQSCNFSCPLRISNSLATSYMQQTDARTFSASCPLAMRRVVTMYCKLLVFGSNVTQKTTA